MVTFFIRNEWGVCNLCPWECFCRGISLCLFIKVNFFSWYLNSSSSSSFLILSVPWESFKFSRPRVSKSVPSGEWHDPSIVGCSFSPVAYYVFYYTGLAGNCSQLNVFWLLDRLQIKVTEFTNGHPVNSASGLKLLGSFSLSRAFARSVDDFETKFLLDLKWNFLFQVFCLSVQTPSFWAFFSQSLPVCISSCILFLDD